jgi:HEAT repeat protein
MFNRILPVALLVLSVTAAGAQPVKPAKPVPPVPPVPPAAAVERALEVDLSKLAQLEMLRGTLDMDLEPALAAGRLAMGQLEGKLAITADAAAYAEAFRGYAGVLQGVTGQKDYVEGAYSPSRESREYDRATRALDRGQYDQAAEAFAKVASMGGRKAEGAMYWQAYALSRVGKRADALACLDELLKKYPSSRWANDAKALQLDVRQASGQTVSPDKTQDEELKAMALRSLMMHDPERAVPMLEGVLKGSSSPKVKDQALFVLAQSGSPQAREILGRVARGQGNPDLQLKAVKYLALYGKQESRQILSDVYAQTQDIDVKRQVLQAFMLAGDRDRLLTAAKSEPNPELRAEAVRQLGIMGARAELGELYKTEASAQVKEQLLQAMFISGASDKLLEIAKAESDAGLRKAAVRDLGLMDSKKTGDALVQFYREDKDLGVKKAVIQGLFIQGNAAALVSLARQETNPELKKQLVSQLSLMKNKEAQDYMLELLK